MGLQKHAGCTTAAPLWNAEHDHATPESWIASRTRIGCCAKRNGTGRLSGNSSPRRAQRDFVSLPGSAFQCMLSGLCPE